MSTVVMPQLGESVREGTISRWLVKVGDRVIEFEPMVEIETDKVSAEVPAPVTGTLREILAREGQTVLAGARIALVEIGGDGATVGSTLETPASPIGPKTGSAAQITAEAPDTASPSAEGVGGERYSPAVRAVSTELNVDLSKVSGTGSGGRVTKKDVQQFAASARAEPLHPSPADRGRASAGPPSAQGDGDLVVPLNRVRRIIAENMSRSKSTIPHAWQTQEVDMSGVVANRAANKAAFQQREGFSLTYLPYVMAATSAALREHPHVNSTFNQTELIVHRDINLGVSMGLEDTLLVPVVRRADGLSIAGLARAVNSLVVRARSKQLTADELAGGTFTVNNSGTFGTLLSYSVINPGQAGILTMAAIVDRPVASNGMIGIRPMMYLCFSLDHRVMDGLLASKFLTGCRLWLQGVQEDSPIW